MTILDLETRHCATQYFFYFTLLCQLKQSQGEIRRFAMVATESVRGYGIYPVVHDIRQFTVIGQVMSVKLQVVSGDIVYGIYITTNFIAIKRTNDR